MNTRTENLNGYVYCAYCGCELQNPGCGIFPTQTLICSCEKAKEELALYNKLKELYNSPLHDSLVDKKDDLKGITFKTCDYRDADPHGYVIYCDPPYAGTKQYANAQKFDYNEFWDIMRKWSEDNVVIVSEQTAPDDWVSIWEHDVSRSIKATDKRTATEKLFVHQSNVKGDIA